MTVTLSARDVRRSVSGDNATVEILKGCNLEISGGGMTSIVGHSGSGKSSLLMCLGGLDKPDSGTVCLNGRDVYQQPRKDRARMLRTDVGFVFQQYNLVPFLSVEENVSLPFVLDHAKVPKELIDRLLEEFGLSHRRSAIARSLSGGEQQRTALCRALGRRPSIVFADEPTGALDSSNTQIVLGALRSMADNGQAVVMVTHDLEAAGIADNVVVMHDGCTVKHLGNVSGRKILDVMTSLRG